MEQAQTFMFSDQIIDITELFKGYSKLRVLDITGIFFIFNKGQRNGSGLQLKAGKLYSLTDAWQIKWEKRGKSIPTFTYKLS